MRGERESRAASPRSAQGAAEILGTLPHDEIARRAYHHYEQRGATDGHDMDDWFQAEQELIREKQQPPRPKLSKSAAA